MSERDFNLYSRCRSCKGTGYINEQEGECRACNGYGFVLAFTYAPQQQQPAQQPVGQPSPPSQARPPGNTGQYQQSQPQSQQRQYSGQPIGPGAITENQKRFIYDLAGRMNMMPDEIQESCRVNFGKNSLDELSKQDASQMIERMKAIAPPPPQR